MEDALRLAVRVLGMTLLLASLAAEATGPSFVEIALDPIAQSKDGRYLLIGSRMRSNSTGGHSLLAENVEWGWVVVSNSGEWREAVQSRLSGASFDADERGERDYRIAQADAEKAHQWNIGAPPPQALARLLPYPITEFRSVARETGRGTPWRPEMKAQRTLHGWTSSTSLTGQGQATFCLGGVAIFHNVVTPDETQGAEFEIPSGITIDVPIEGGLVHEDPGMDMMEVDAVALVECAR